MDILDMDEDQLRTFRWKEISLVMQSAMNALNPVLTVGDQIRDVVAAHEGAPATDARISDLLELVGIEASRANSYPHELSGGMRQRVVIAMALALRPPLVFMDEPTTALDVVVQKGILDKIAALKETIGFSILLITHDLALMLDFCTRIGILYGGRLAESAPSSRLRTEAKHPYTQGLMRAFPDVHADPSDLVGIPGTPPDPRAPPSGCRFHPRCPHVTDRCRQAQPPISTVGPDHQVACWLYS
jgi:peptide/nickel transport system ATP-binding protein